MGGTDSAGIAADIDFVAHIDADTGSNTDWVGNVQDDRVLSLFHPEPGYRSS